MDLHKKLFHAVENKLFTDLTLILVDRNGNTKEINVHKIVLIVSSEYFKNMFSNFSEKSSNTITINDIPNVNIFHDVINGFYGEKTNCGKYEEWYYLLQLHKCYDLLNLPICIDPLFDINIPVEGFELLLDFVEIIGYNKKTIDLICHHFPENYNLMKLPDELIKEIIKGMKKYELIVYDNIYDLKKFGISHKFKRVKYSSRSAILYSANKICFSSDNKFIGACIPSKIMLLDKNNMELIKNYEIKTYFPYLKDYENYLFFVDFYFTEDSRMVIAHDNIGITYLLDATTGNIIDQNKYITKIDSKNTIMGWTKTTIVTILLKNKGTINADKINTFELLYKHEFGYKIDINKINGSDLVNKNFSKMIFSQRGKQIATVAPNHTIEVWNLIDNEFVHFGEFKISEDVNRLFYSNNGRMLYILTTSNKIYTWNTTTNKLHDYVKINDKIKWIEYYGGHKLFYVDSNDTIWLINVIDNTNNKINSIKDNNIKSEIINFYIIKKNILVTCYRNGKIVFWKFKPDIGLKNIKTIDAGTAVKCISFSTNLMSELVAKLRDHIHTKKYYDY